MHAVMISSFCSAAVQTLRSRIRSSSVPFLPGFATDDDAQPVWRCTVCTVLRVGAGVVVGSPLATCDNASLCLDAMSSCVRGVCRCQPGYYVHFNHCGQLIISYVTATTVLRPFFRGHPGEPVPEENFLILWRKGRSTEADTPTIRLGATPSGLTSALLHHPPYFYRPDALPVAQPTASKHWRQNFRVLRVLKALTTPSWSLLASSHSEKWCGFHCIYCILLSKQICLVS